MPRNTRRWLLAGLMLATGVGLAVMASGKPKLVSGQSRVLLVGDSHAEGLAPPLGALAKDQKISFKAVYQRGTRIDQWSSSPKLEQELQGFRPTVVLVSLGTNDEYLSGSGVADRQKPHAAELLRKLRAAGLEVVWVGPPKLPKTSNGIVPMLKALVGQQYFPSDALQIPMGPDGIHPTARGYAGWAGALWQWLA